MTGRWPTVLNVWQVPCGWSGWAGFLERTYGSVRRQLDVYFDQFDEVRSGGQDFLMAGAPWSPWTSCGGRWRSITGTGWWGCTKLS
jgi:hypothetical protein